MGPSAPNPHTDEAIAGHFITGALGVAQATPGYARYAFDVAAAVGGGITAYLAGAGGGEPPFNPPSQVVLPRRRGPGRRRSYRIGTQTLLRNRRSLRYPLRGRTKRRLGRRLGRKRPGHLLIRRRKRRRGQSRYRRKFPSRRYR